MNYIKLNFGLKTQEESEMITAQLSDTDPEGFEEDQGMFYAFFNEEDFDEKNIKEILNPYSFEFTIEIIPLQNWNAQWESNFEPIRLNEQVGVRAHFHPPFTDCVYDILITPKMSFGTGHHETTQMMLEYIDEIDFKGKSVLDFGCGTGVLAILASMKGASSVIGIDHDPWSVENARENCSLNHCHNITITDKDLHQIEGSFDLILANINLNILVDHMSKMKQLLRKEGSIILSGILFSDVPKMTECFTDVGFTLLSQKRKNEWVALYIK